MTRRVIISQPLGSQDIALGGPGSGNWAHVGRPGHRGGSQSNQTVMTIRRGMDWKERQQAAKGKGADRSPRRTAITDVYFGSPFEAGDEYNRYSHHSGMEALRNGGVDVLVDPKDFDNDGTRGNVKDELVSELARLSGEDYDSVNAIIGQWAHSSNDEKYESLSIQEAISDELEVDLSDWQKGKISYLAEKGRTGSIYHVLGSVPEPHEKTRGVIRAMYDLTQAHFKKLGIKEVVLFRGVSTKVETKYEDLEFGDVVQWKGNSAESWSVTYSTAKSFAGYSGIIISARVPVSRILSTARTGFGCLDEEEMVILGNIGQEDYVTVVN